MRWSLVLVLLVACSAPAFASETKKRPNILWITCEDMGPHIGPYGDKFANTPNLNKFAKRSLRYKTAWSNAPVCAPARTTIITGMYASSLGAEHMRSLVKMPANMFLFPHYLRLAGYFCTNHIKEDYNVIPNSKTWDESSKKAHYKNRGKDQPFFAVFNNTVTHESQIRTRPHKWILDRTKVPIPPYHPDTPEVREDWTQYYDNITAMDRWVGELLAELEAAGLAEDTIIFFFSDHGSGMPGNKRTASNRGLHVPMMVHFPKNFEHLAPKDYQPGAITDRLVSFVDLGPTVLSLADVPPPVHMQGKAFLGKHATEPREYVFGYRGRMDEKIDLVRSVRDKRYVYVRNFMPHKTPGQHLNYMFQTPTTKVWKKLYDDGKLNEVQTAFWKPHPSEELYDLEKDPHETTNVADSPEHAKEKVRLYSALTNQMVASVDLGILPEAEMYRRAKEVAPYSYARDSGSYQHQRIIGVAGLASDRRIKFPPILKKFLNDEDSALRAWAVMRTRIAGKETVHENAKLLAILLHDPSPSVRIAAAEALGKFGDEADLKASLKVLAEYVPLKANEPFLSVQALNAVVELGPRAEPIFDVVRNANKNAKGIEPRIKDLVPRLIEEITGTK